MTIYTHVTKGYTAEILETLENGDVKIFIDDTSETKIVKRISFVRWWVAKEVETTETEAAEPETAEPENVEPETAEPETVETETAEPETTDVETAEPETVEIETAETETTEPEVAEPEATETETASYTPLSVVTVKLENLFNILNDIYFDSKLPKPVITVQSTPKAYGHCSIKKIWAESADSDNGYYEINIGAEYLNRPTENTAATLLHEMVHLYCRENDINETCQKGRYHNKTFKAIAEERDLEIDYRYDIGYSLTTPTEALCEKLKNAGIELVNPFANLARVTKVKAVSTVKATREKNHAYVCPICGQTVKTTQDLFLICGHCKEEMTRED